MLNIKKKYLFKIPKTDAHRIFVPTELLEMFASKEFHLK